MLLNATRLHAVEDAQRSGVDQIILELEDAVAPQHKSEARAGVARWLEHGVAWVRINDFST
ncbi:hypothetical protein GXW84_26505 [Rhodococcus sp. IEGM 248]|nr:hypothetical protein [Rhodococcus sp. IEGM 248]